MKKGIIWFISVLVLVAVGLGGYSYLGKKKEKGQADLAVSMVEGAEAYFEKNGKEKTLAALSDPTGPFSKGELYVFAYDLTGTATANVAKPSLVGKNAVTTPDSKGRLFRKEIVERANRGDSGWVDYSTLNPKTNENEEKTTYFKKVGDQIFCAGIYKNK